MSAPSAFPSRKLRPFGYPYPAPPSRLLSLLNAERLLPEAVDKLLKTFPFTCNPSTSPVIKLFDKRGSDRQNTTVALILILFCMVLITDMNKKDISQN